MFAECDEIWHAGDIGSHELADKLEKLKPLRAVYGNIDDKKMQLRFPEDLRFTCDGVDILITHIAGSPPKYNARVKKLLLASTPDVLICGHSHILKVMRDPAFNNMLFINPGAAGIHGFHNVKTLIRFSIIERSIKDLEVIELGKRGEILKEDS